MQAIKYEYAVVDKSNETVVEILNTRSQAREAKNFYKENYEMPAAILQRKYQLTEERVIR
jgi:hypothetical protein